MADSQSRDRGFVLVTGTSTGIGAATVSRLGNIGFHVFAASGVRRTPRQREARRTGRDAADDRYHRPGDDRRCGEDGRASRRRARPGRTRQQSGIVKSGPLEFQPLDDFRRQLEVNLIGPLSVVQAFLPLIRRGRGRIVNVGSIGGLLVVPIQGAYSASKFGLEAVSDALRLELRQWAIPVSHVDPGVTDTPIFGKTLGELDRALGAFTSVATPSTTRSLRRSGRWSRSRPSRPHRPRGSAIIEGPAALT